MGGGGGFINTVVSVVTSPITAPIKIAETIAPEATKKVEDKLAGVPVVGTLSQGAVAASNLAPDALNGGSVGKDLGAIAKAGVVVGGAAVGGASGAVIGNMITQRGIDVGALTGGAAAYLGNTLSDNLGVDFSSFFPEKGSDSFNPGGGSVGNYFKGPSNIGSAEPNDSNNGGLLLLAAGAALVFILILRRKK